MPAPSLDDLRDLLRRTWGFEDFRPSQAEAINCVLEERDSVVVLPTGGGKSLCFQAPALLLPGLTVVVSPLVALMKDQVDGLVENGIPAACANHMTSPEERRTIRRDIASGRLKLLYLSPERLLTEQSLAFLKDTPLSYFAIDEAHCISEWGHEFRPVYRQLRQLKEHFPGIPVHAYTATATPHVREDIGRELGLEDPRILVGSFDRPNLVYRVQRRANLLDQIREIINRYPEDSGVIYCIRRAEVEELAESLQQEGIKALPYHAGLPDDTRHDNQDAFINDRAQIIVATVAFGMGIDKSNVRFVIHAAAPKSLENYQQESGRAGRDGLEAECWLFHSPQDLQVWRSMQQNLAPEALEISRQLLKGIDDYCQTTLCRHQALVRYFGQELDSENCAACDLCLAEVEFADDALIIAQKILSCVARLRENYGGEYTTQVLLGAKEARILENGHHQLSTWGLLSDHPKPVIRGWIEQLVGQGFLDRVGEYNILKLTLSARDVLRGEVIPRLLKPTSGNKKRRKSKTEVSSWAGVNRDLFESLRELRLELAQERGVPPYVIFPDATLRALSRVRPSSLEAFLDISGIGQKKKEAYGALFLERIDQFCDRTPLPRDVH